VNKKLVEASEHATGDLPRVGKTGPKPKRKSTHCTPRAGMPFNAFFSCRQKEAVEARLWGHTVPLSRTSGFIWHTANLPEVFSWALLAGLRSPENAVYGAAP
jgi:hypothetical protein